MILRKVPRTAGHSPRQAAGAGLLLLSWLLAGPACAATVVAVEMAAADTPVVVIDAPSGEAPPSQQPADWAIADRVPVAVGRSTTVQHEGTSAQGFPLVLRHRIYLRLAEPLPQGSYDLHGPDGKGHSFVFYDHATRSESIKLNQAGYGTSREAWAYVAVRRGDLGPATLEPMPSFRVVRQSDAAVVAQGMPELSGADDDGNAPSADIVYRLSLAAVPTGGPYMIVLDGVGRSPYFTISAQVADHIAYTVARGLYHQRCGMALEWPYTSHTRAQCHRLVQVTDAEPPGFITLSGPTRSISGGYHDAGDFDRRQFHTLIPAWLLTFHESFPHRLPDASLDLPESGNGIPDLLDEALWGVKVWEQLQEADGGVRAGTEADAHPAYGVVNAATDTLVYRTYRRDAHATASAAGLFAQAARLLQPYDPARAAVLLQKAKIAWSWLEREQAPPVPDAQRMYAALQLWLATGETQYHERFKTCVLALDGAAWPQQYHPVYFSLSTAVDGMVFAPYFVPYLLVPQAQADLAVRAVLMGWLQDASASIIAKSARSKYPVGAPSNVAWGSLTNQGRYAEPLIYLYRLNGDETLRDHVLRWSAYPLGANPLGKSFITGLGSDAPREPLHLDSWFTAQAGLGPVPGLTIYGPFAQPSNIAYQSLVWQQTYPAWHELPPARRYSEGWSLVPSNEFSTTETMALNAVMFAFLASDGASIFADGFDQ